MKFIKPYTITKGIDKYYNNLIYSNMPNFTGVTYDEWSTNKEYAIDDILKVTSEHKFYKSLVNTNKGNIPSSSPTQWVEETTVLEWSDTTTYNKGDIVYIDSLKRLFQSNKDANLDRNPAEIAIDFTGTEYYKYVFPFDTATDVGGWTKLSSNNEYRMFDEIITTTSTSNILGETIVVEIEANKATSLALLGMTDVDSVKVCVFDTLYPKYSGDDSDYVNGDITHHDDNKLYEFTSPSTWVFVGDVAQQGDCVFAGGVESKDPIVNLWSYYTAEWVTPSEINILDIPLSFSGKIRIEFFSTAYVTVGLILSGKNYEVGYTTYGTTNDFQDFSTIEKDEETGYVNIIKGNIIKRVTIPIDVRNGCDDISKVQLVERTIRENMMGETLYFVGDDVGVGYSNLNLLGFIESTNLSIDDYNSETASFTIRGVI